MTISRLETWSVLCAVYDEEGAKLWAVCDVYRIGMVPSIARIGIPDRSPKKIYLTSSSYILYTLEMEIA